MEMEQSSDFGRIAFLPWVTLPRSVDVGAFRFTPVMLDKIDTIAGSVVAGTVAANIRTYVDQSGTPIKSCTLILRPRNAVAWNMPDKVWPQAIAAAELLAFGALAEQRFLVHPIFHGHMNSTMFRPVNHFVTVGSSDFSINYPRRGGSLQVAGRTVANTVFQQPYQIEGTRCDRVNGDLIRAISRAERKEPELGSAIRSAIQFFLTGHAEMQELGPRNDVMLSAMAFERLLAPEQNSAQGLAKALTALLSRFPSRTMASSKRMKCDPEPAWIAEQMTWPLHRKWIKELYEVRSTQAHRGAQSKFSSNFDNNQHLVIAAFVFSLAVKLRLSDAGLYVLSSDDVAACEVIDDLIDSNWGTSFDNPPEWPKILDEAQGARSLREVISKAIAAVRETNSVNSA